MPIAIGIDPGRGWVLAYAHGLVTYADLEMHLGQEEALRAVGDPELFDATGAKTNVTSQQVKALVTWAHAMLRRGRVGPTAFVADDDLAFGMARMYQLLAELDGIVVGVFRNRKDAEQWLADTVRAEAG